MPIGGIRLDHLNTDTPLIPETGHGSSPKPNAGNMSTKCPPCGPDSFCWPQKGQCMCQATMKPEVNGKCESQGIPAPETSGKHFELCAGERCPPDAFCAEHGGRKMCWCTMTNSMPVNGECHLQEPPKDEHTESPGHNASHKHGVIHHGTIQQIVNSSNNSNQTTVLQKVAGKSGSESLLLQVVLPLGVFLFLGILVVVFCLRRHRRHRLGPKRGSEAVVKNSDGVLLLDRMNNINKNPTYFVPPTDDPAQRKFLVREIAMDNVVLVDVVGEGAFGQVYRGDLFCPETDTHQLVAVKVLKENVSNEIREDFEREVEIMSAFDHDNILKLIGVVTQHAGQSPYMIFEYMVHGDLAELLRKNDPVLRKKEEDVIRLQKNHLVDIATQIANGMRYLTSQHFVHRDLATRNCLVGDTLVVKISDFGMSRDIYTCDYYKIGGSRMLPVRWMSPESVKYGRFTSESDAWAYGVVLWEIFSCGRQPYYGHSNEEVIRFLDTGILLQRPEDCPSTIYHIMLGCWKADPKERLTFDKIHKHLQDYHQRLVKMAATQAPPPQGQSQGQGQANEGDAEIKRAPTPDPPQVKPQAPPTVLNDPRTKPLLKATQSDPVPKVSKPQPPSEAVKHGSQPLTQNSGQPKSDLANDKEQTIIDLSGSLSKLQLEGDHSAVTAPPPAIKPPPPPPPKPSCQSTDVLDDGDVKIISQPQQCDSPQKLSSDLVVDIEKLVVCQDVPQQQQLTDGDEISAKLASSELLFTDPSTTIICTNPAEVV